MRPTPLAAALAVAVATPLLALAGTTTASAACPRNEVGQLRTHFDPEGTSGSAEEASWSVRGQDLTTAVTESSDLVVDVAMWPAPKGRSRFDVEAPGGYVFLEAVFEEGDVSLYASAPEGQPTHHPDVLSYEPGAWNNLHLRFDLDADKARVKLNGQRIAVPSEAGTEIMQIWYTSTYLTDVQDTQTAFFDNLTVTEVSSGTPKLLYSEDFDDHQAEPANPGFTFVAPTWQPSPGSGCEQPSTLTVAQRQTNEKITISGSVSPDVAGWPVVVRLAKKQDGRFVQVGKTRRITLDQGSAFRTSFAHPANAASCRATVIFEGTPVVAADKVVRTFAC